MGDDARNAFRVDLRGVVDLLARHVYSSPNVFIRELLQNAVDATTARRQLDPSTGAIPIQLIPADAGGNGALVVSDGGVGLQVDEVHEFLATIGGSSKRDDFDLPRSGFLGRFGVGLLSCFVVAERIEMHSRSARGGPVAEFVGHDDGTYIVRELASDDPAAGEPAVDGPAAREPARSWSERLADGPGTVIRLQPRRGSEGLVTAATVERLAREYGAILPFPVLVHRSNADPVDVTDPEPPWRDPPQIGRSATAGWAAREAWCEPNLGFRPLAAVSLEVPAVGLRGCAFVRSDDVGPGGESGHRVYLRRMLVGDNVTGLAPSWAFFVRCVIDADELQPTASREALMNDDALALTCDAIGEQLRAWLVGLGATNPELLQRVLRIHGRAAKSLAVHDDEVLAALAPWLTVETSEGPLSLPAIGRRTTTIQFTATLERFRQLAPIAIAQGVLLANGGYVYDAELLRRIGEVVPEVSAREIHDADVVATFDEVSDDRRRAVDAFVAVAEGALVEVGCSVEVKAFEPEMLPTLYFFDPDAARRRELRTVGAEVDPSWAELLRSFDDGGDDRPRLVCNDRHPLVARLVERAGVDPDVVSAAVRALYGQALLLGHRRVRGSDLALINRSLLDLVDRATRP